MGVITLQRAPAASGAAAGGEEQEAKGGEGAAMDIEEQQTKQQRQQRGHAISKRAGRGRGLPPLVARAQQRGRHASLELRENIITAIRELGGRGGSSVYDIAKYLEANGVAVKRTALELALQKGVAEGKLAQKKQSFFIVGWSGGSKRPKTRKNRRKKKPSPKRKRRKKRQISKKRRFSRKRKRKWRKTKKKY